MNKFETAILANGCFWCTEAIFQQLNGVISIMPGYIGGKVENPNYELVCTGITDHAEAIKIIFDTTKISFEQILEVFFATHDPTTLNRQGNDIGTQYRSEIFYLNKEQKKIAELFINIFNSQNVFGKPVVTKITEATNFFAAEDYHVNYYNTHKDKLYCSMVIAPKVEKFKLLFTDLL